MLTNVKTGLESGKIVKLQPDAPDGNVIELMPQPLPAAIYNEDEMIVVNGKMLKIVEEASRIAPLNINVLIIGESGVGKEELARLIHKKSGREGPFIFVNCAALPENLVESELFGHRRGAFTSAISDYKGKLLMANRGTLFLDEIGDMRQDIQAKLLQVLDQRNFGQEQYFYPIGSEQKAKSDFRIICASNQDLEGLVENRKFRQDLFFRLNVARFHIPPLRERPEEIPILAQHILQRIVTNLGNRDLYFSPECLEFISGLKWPGNVRRLQNLIMKAVALMEKNKKVIEAKDFKKLVIEDDGFSAVTGDFLASGKTLNALKQKVYLEALEFYDGDVAKVAKHLSINQRTIYRFLERRNQKPLDFANKKHSDVPRKKEIVAETEQKPEKEKTPLPPQDFTQEKDAKKDEVSTMPTNEVASKGRKRFTRELLINALKENDWSQTRVARVLKSNRVYVCRLVKKLSIKPPSGIWQMGKKPQKPEKEKTPLPPQDFTQEKDAKKDEISPASVNEVVARNKKRFNKELLINALGQNNWNQTKTAAALGIARLTVWKKIKELRILPPSGSWKKSVKKTNGTGNHYR